MHQWCNGSTRDCGIGSNPVYLPTKQKKGRVTMEVVIKHYKDLPCELEVFTINGIKADRDDFGFLVGYCGEYEDYSCSNRVFVINESKKEETMLKYRLTEVEYDMVCSELRSECYIDECNYCI